MYHIFFIYSCVNEHLGCFHVLAINNHAATKIGWGKEGRTLAQYLARMQRSAGAEGSTGVSSLVQG